MIPYFLQILGDNILAKRKYAQQAREMENSLPVKSRKSAAVKGGLRRAHIEDSSEKSDNIFNFKSYVAQRKTVAMIPKSVAQEEYIELLQDQDKLIVFATGPAGTGKTMLAVLAAIKAYKEGIIQKIIVTRPAVEVENEKIGFLPGDLNEKMAPWTRPIFDVMKEYYTVAELAQMLAEEIIEISPLAFMRGRSFKNAFIIADEMQNATPSQLKMLLTRIGENCKLVVTGDIRQTDRVEGDNGLIDFKHRSANFAGHDFICGVEFTGKDIQRHAAVEEVLRIYGDI